MTKAQDTAQDDAQDDAQDMPEGTATFAVEGWRPLRSDNPDIFLVIKGTAFWKDGERVSIKSRAITKEERHSPLFSINPEAGTFTVPVGKRGRRATPGLSAEDIAALLDETAD